MWFEVFFIYVERFILGFLGVDFSVLFRVVVWFCLFGRGLIILFFNSVRLFVRSVFLDF